MFRCDLRLKWKKHPFLDFPGTRNIYKLQCTVRLPTLFGLAIVISPPGKKGGERRGNLFSIRFTPFRISYCNRICRMVKKADKTMAAIIAPFWSPGSDLLTKSLASSEPRSFAINFQEIRFHFSPKVMNGQKHLHWQHNGKWEYEDSVPLQCNYIIVSVWRK